MKSKSLDLLGISAAAICLIHCLLIPVFFIIPFESGHDAWIDLVFLIIGLNVVYKVTKKTTSLPLKVLLWGSVLTIAISITLDLVFDVHSPLMYAGAAGLIVGHLINYKRNTAGGTIKIIERNYLQIKSKR